MTHSQRIDHELLLAHAGWVRTLAGNLVDDPVRADDVAQDTLLAALQAPPRGADDERSLRAWLARVAFNLAHLARRRSARRRYREEDVARPEHISSTVEAVERASQLRSVVDAVLGLKEPYRSAVLLRYFDGLSTTEIAERTGSNPVAVRKRVSRGLGLLRERLDQDHGGDGVTWQRALAPLVAGLTPRTAPLPPVPLATAEVVRIGTLLVAAAVLAFVLGFAMYAGTAGERPAEAAVTATPEPRPAAEDLAASRTPEAVVPLRADLVETPRRPTGPTIRPRGDVRPERLPEPAAPARAGRVIDLYGRPVSGMRVARAGRPEEVLATTDALGTFAVDAGELFGSGATEVRLAAHAAGTTTLRAGRVRAGAARDATIVVARAVEVAGLVIDELGRPVAGVSVQLDVAPIAYLDLHVPLDGTAAIEHAVTSDARGRFHWPVLPTAPGLSLRTVGPAGAGPSVPVPAASTDSLRLFVAAGAVARVEPGRGARFAHAPGGPPVLLATAAGDRSKEEEAVARAAGEPGDDAALRPWVRALPLVMNAEQSLFADPASDEGSGATWRASREFRGASADQVESKLGGEGDSGGDGGEGSGAGGSGLGDRSGERGGRLVRGTVFAADGTAQAGARVRAVPSEDTTVTDENGRFRLWLAADSPEVVWIEHDEHAPAGVVLDGRAEEGVDVEVALEAPSYLRFFATDWAYWAEEIRVVDAEGTTVPVRVGGTVTDRVPVEGGKTPILEVGDGALELVVIVDGVELGRMALAHELQVGKLVVLHP